MKKKIIIIISILIFLLVLGIGLTYAYFVYHSNDTDLSFEVDGCLVTADFEDGASISSSFGPAISKDDEDNVFSKLIELTAECDNAVVDMNLNITSIDEELIDESFVYELYSGDTLITSGNFANVNNGDVINLFSGVTLAGNVVNEYIIYIYIDGTVDNPSSMAGKSLDAVIDMSGTNSYMDIYYLADFSYTGDVQSVSLKKGTYILEVWGAQGGYRSSSTYGGMGGYSVGTITLSSATTLYVYVGGSGNTGGTSGGFNGGGMRYSYKGGGGATDISLNGGSWYDSNHLYSRIIVAGGGGSDGSTSRGGGAGGGENGIVPSTTSYGSCLSGYGTQTGVSGGSSYLASSRWTKTSPTTQASTYAGFGFGGAGPYRSSGYGGAGGGGWYGGGGNYPDGSADDDAGGRGGSGYVYTSTTASNYPSGCLLNSSYYLTDASTVAGNTSFTSPTGESETGHSGDGYARITRIR